MTKSQAVPFPDLPLPSKYKRISQQTVKPQVESTPLPKPPENPSPPPKSLPIPATDVLEMQIGGELEPEPPKIRDQGDHIIEEIDYSDYQ